MQIIPPFEVTDARILSTNIPETDADLWNAGTVYAIGNLVRYAHRVYEALTNNTGKDPRTSPTDWLDLGATNRFKAFDQRISDPVVFPAVVEYEISHDGTPINSVALFGLAGTLATVETVDPVDGTVFSETVDLLDNTAVMDWYSYFFEPAGVQRPEVLFRGIPPYKSAKTLIRVTRPGEDVHVGQIVLGAAVQLGVAVFGTSISIQDYSRKERDQFGNPIIVPRAFAQTADYDVRLTTQDARRVQNTLAAYRTKPVVWLSDADEAFGTTIYGYYRRFDIVLASPTISNATIEVEGLI